MDMFCGNGILAFGVSKWKDFHVVVSFFWRRNRTWMTEVRELCICKLDGFGYSAMTPVGVRPSHSISCVCHSVGLYIHTLHSLEAVASMASLRKEKVLLTGE